MRLHDRLKEYLPVAMTTTDVTTTSLLPVLLDHISYSREAEDIGYDDNKVFTEQHTNNVHNNGKTCLIL